MKIAIKNFLTTLRRYKMASVLNIAGMTLAFLAFYVIMSQVYYDITYNCSIKDSDRTYILLTRFAEDWIALASRGVAERTFGLWPDVECSGTIRNKGLGAEYVWVKRTEYNYDRYDYRTATMSLPLLERAVVPHCRGRFAASVGARDRHYLGVAGRAYGGACGRRCISARHGCQRG